MFKLLCGVDGFHGDTSCFQPQPTLRTILKNDIFHYFSSIHFRVADKLNVTSLHWSFFLFKNTSVSNILILLISVQWIHHPAVGNVSSTSRWTAGVTVRSCPTRRCYRDLHPADWNLNSTTWTQTWRSEQGVTFHQCHTKLHLTFTVF